MAVLSLNDYRPTPRYDDLAWTEARIEQSELEAGPWVELETIVLSPVDADPTSPAYRDFTVEYDTADGTWFRVVFVDADGDEEPTDPVDATGPSYRPLVADVAALIRSRTKPTDGQVPAGTFTTNTRPTAEEVENLITQAAAQVEAAFIGDIPASSEDDAKRAITLRVAQWVEISYYPEQVEDGDIVPALAVQADVAMSSLVKTSGVRAMIEEAEAVEAAEEA
jgi:hypothetical protein